MVGHPKAPTRIQPVATSTTALPNRDRGSGLSLISNPNPTPTPTPTPTNLRSALIEAARKPPRLGRPKTAASERTITLPNIALETLALHLQQHPPVDGIVWTTQRGAFLRRGSFSRIWRKAVAASVGQPSRVHDLRHTHASWLIAAGEHPKAIQTRLGHSSIQVTMDRYGHLMKGLDDRTADRLDNIAESWGGPGAAQTEDDETESQRANPPVTRGVWMAVPTRFELAFPA